jgi:hypothetical protein
MNRPSLRTVIRRAPENFGHDCNVPCRRVVVVTAGIHQPLPSGL